MSSNINSNTYGVIFRYSSTSFDHLRTISEKKKETNENSSTSDSNETSISPRNKATAGALGSALIVGFLTFFLTGSNDDNPIYLVASFTAGIAGWKLCGGDSVREAEIPKDGGYDAKFVEDLPIRLSSILNRLNQEMKLNSQNNNIEIIKSSNNDGNNQRHIDTTTRFIEKVHGSTYLENFRNAVKDAKETDRVRRLNPTVMRTLIDQYSYDAAFNSVSDWMDTVDSVLSNSQQNNKVEFALTRPPSHHACRSKGMGGCMLNSVAIAAFYALDGAKSNGVSNVAILDIDAHHGNGIAHCIQDDARIRYCSIHEAVTEKNWFQNQNDLQKKEASDDPRRPDVDDSGILGNILNVPLESNTGWETGYKNALIEKALPFLLNNNPDILLVAAGFDALTSDRTSSLQLQPKDYASMGYILQEKFGSRIAFGLEGGYSWQEGSLGEAVVNLVQPWASIS